MSHNLNPKTMDDFAPNKRAGGLHERTMETIRAHVGRIRAESDDAGQRGRTTEVENIVEEAQHSIDTCDAVLDKLDEMEGRR